MHLLDQQLILSPTDLANAIACDHLVSLELAVAEGKLTRPEREDAGAELLAQKGDKHETDYRQSLASAGQSVTEIHCVSSRANDLRAAEAATVAAMRNGVDYIYQATFFDGRWRGQADFLQKVDLPSAFGEYSYEAIDTKLARHVRVSALLQLCNYSEHLTRLQGVEPQNMHLQLGDGSRHTVLYKDFSAYYQIVKRRFETSIDNWATDTYPNPVRHCTLCEWNEVCTAKREADDHLSLVAGMRRSQVEKLNTTGIKTLTQLANSGINTVPGMGDRTVVRLREQARLQNEQRANGALTYELLEPRESGVALIHQKNEGLGALPTPSDRDLFFDMEGDPFVGKLGIEYLFGVVQVVDGTSRYRSWWGHDDAGEKRAFEGFIDFVMGELAIDPDLHIYHYANYEPVAMKKLAARYATREQEVDCLLRGRTFVDLYRVVKQGVRISQPSYSIKKLEPFYMQRRETNVQGGAASVVAYEEWLDTGEQSLLDDIERYNRDDCESTLLLRNWLEQRREEAAIQFGEIPRPTPVDSAPSAELSKAEAHAAAVAQALFPGTPDDAKTQDEQGRLLLSRLLEWHRRESKAEWWRFYELLDMSHTELYEDREALEGLQYLAPVGHSSVFAYEFDAAQEHRIVENRGVVDADTRKPAGEVVYIDDERGIIHIKRNFDVEPGALQVIIPAGPVRHDAQQAALLEMGEWVAANGLEATGPFSCGLDLLMRRPPRLQSGLQFSAAMNGENDLTKQVCEIVGELECSTLAVQGPPGTGKTFTGAELVLSLVKQGKRVGVTATSHKVVGNLLERIHEHAGEQQDVQLLQLAKEKDRCAADGVTFATDNKSFDAEFATGQFQVVGGTAWLFSRAAMRKSVDVLIVDEAGQFSLADALAVSTAADSLVLLGDPQQLAQPSKGVHPEGAGSSALAHLLAGQHTIAGDQGVLLNRTWRMHPNLCEFVSDTFYDGQLEPVESCYQQTVHGDDEWAGAGLRCRFVEHSGNKTSSVEEAAAINDGIAELLGRSWTNQFGITKALTLEDFLVLTPYNAQVSLLRRSLPEGTRIGTVDKFQGQEAAVAFYSLAASSADDISRGMDFLFNLNRLNVAVSRARCLTFLVFNPRLLAVQAHSAGQARRANALCRAAIATAGVQQAR
jgi:predicted RecB family nuclease